MSQPDADTREGRRSRLRRMVGRDPGEGGRSATPLELLYDLVFVVAFAQAGAAAAHLIAEGHIAAALAGFGFAMFAIVWAWINFTWFASAFDTDDWFYRVTTMVQMVGALVLALGIPAMFHSIDAGEPLDNAVIVAGYIVMRVAMVTQWLRVARDDATHRRSALTYALTILIAQVGWLVLLVAHIESLVVYLVAAVVLYVIELAGPVIAERQGDGTPWHPHHIAERYGLLTIIALGEGILGTVAAVSAIVQEQGWSPEAIAVVVAGISLTFGLWWVYFIPPWGHLLEVRRGVSFGWGYGHILLFAAIAAVGAGIHVAAYVVEGSAEIGTVGALLSTVVPVVLFLVVYFVIYSAAVRELDPFHLGLFAASLAVLAGAVWLASAEIGLGIPLIVAAAAPFVIVVGYELIGHRHMTAVLERRI